MPGPDDRTQRALAPTPTQPAQGALTPFQQRADQARMDAEQAPPAVSPETARAQEVVQALATNPIVADVLSQSGVSGVMGVDPEERMRRATLPTPVPQRGTIGRAAIAAPPPAQPTPEELKNGGALPGTPAEQFPITSEAIGPAEEGIVTGLEDQSKVEQTVSEQAANVMAEAEQEIQLRQFKQQQRLSQIADEEARRLHQLDQQITQLRNTHFDADRLFSNASGATQFGAALGIAVGHMLQVRNNIMFPGSNTPNAALNIINDAIERDIRTQTQQFQNSITVLGQGRTAMGLARQVGLDQAAVEAFASEKILEQVERHLTQVAVRHQGTQAGFRLQQAADQFRLQRGENAAAWERAVQQMLLQQANRGRARARVFEDFVDFARFNPANPDAEQQYLQWRDHIGTSQAGAANETFVANRNIISQIDTLVRLVESAQTGETLAGPLAAEIEAMTTNLKAAYNHANHLGTMDQGTLDLLEQVIGDATQVLSLRSSFLRRIGALRRNAVGNTRSLLAPLFAGPNPVLIPNTPTTDSTFAQAPNAEEEARLAEERAAAVNDNIVESFLGIPPAPSGRGVEADLERMGFRRE